MATIATQPTGEDVTAFIDAHADTSVLEQLVRNAWHAASTD